MSIIVAGIVINAIKIYNFNGCGFMKNKKLICVVLAVALIISGILSISFTAFANTVSYDYNPEAATLTITGNGDVSNYTETNLDERPWHAYMDETKKIVISDGITAVGDYAFAKFKYVESVEISNSVKSIGTASFAGINNLLEITVPDSVATVGDYAFGYDENMQVPQGFLVHCSTKSAAQHYCFRNNIMFDSPMDGKRTEAYITESDELQLWSFVPLTDGKLTFYSVGDSITVGCLFDAENYVYGTTLKELQQSSLAYGDIFSNGDFGFKLTYNLKAGKRYYLGARFYRNDDYNAKFTVVTEYVCSEHKYAVSSTVKPTCEDYGYDVYTCIGCGETYKEKLAPLGHDLVPIGVENQDFVLGCSRCSKTAKESFVKYLNEPATDENRKFDVNSDGIINAKDYAILYKTKK